MVKPAATYVQGSTNIGRYAYDPDTQTLQVTFKRDGKMSDTYQFAGVNPETLVAFRAAPSKGSFFAREIRGKYDSRKLDPEVDEVWS